MRLGLRVHGGLVVVVVAVVFDVCLLKKDSGSDYWSCVLRTL